MIGRRDILIGSACLAAAGAAYGLKPRRHVSLLGKRSLTDIVPASFGPWTSLDVSGLVAPQIEGSLADRLYNETLGRIYRNENTGDEVMMLMAHGQTNTDDLQLHRPESCYPAFGFALSSNQATKVALGQGVSIPGRQLVADAPGRRENIVYWSRLGEFLPIDGRDQGQDRLKTAMSGIIADGLLARFSAVDPEPQRGTAMVHGFIPHLVRSVPAAGRSALVGTRLAAAMTQARI